MARKFNGTSDFGKSATLRLSRFNKLTLAFWQWQDAFGGGDNLALEYTTNANNVGFFVDPNSSSPSLVWAVRLNMQSGTGNGTVASFARPSAAAWHHFVILFDGTVSGAAQIPTMYLDGVSQSLSYFNTAGVSGLNFVNDNLYFMSRAGGSLFNAGREAHVAIWGNALLTAQEARALYYGASPLAVRPQSLAYYWPLDGYGAPGLDRGPLKANAAFTGSTFTPGPPRMSDAPILLPLPSPQFVMPPTEPPPPQILMAQACL